MRDLELGRRRWGRLNTLFHQMRDGPPKLGCFPTIQARIICHLVSLLIIGELLQYSPTK